MPLKPRQRKKPRGPQYQQSSERGFEGEYQYDELQAEEEYSDEDVKDRAAPAAEGVK
jgi:hypothetical protein